MFIDLTLSELQASCRMIYTERIVSILFLTFIYIRNIEAECILIEIMKIPIIYLKSIFREEPVRSGRFIRAAAPRQPYAVASTARTPSWLLPHSIIVLSTQHPSFSSSFPPVIDSLRSFFHVPFILPIRFIAPPSPCPATTELFQVSQLALRMTSSLGSPL